MYISIFVIHAETPNGNEILGATLSLERAVKEINRIIKDTGHEAWYQIETISEDYITKF